MESFDPITISTLGEAILVNKVLTYLKTQCADSDADRLILSSFFLDLNRKCTERIYKEHNRLLKGKLPLFDSPPTFETLDSATQKLIDERYHRIRETHPEVDDGKLYTLLYYPFSKSGREWEF